MVRYWFQEEERVFSALNRAARFTDQLWPNRVTLSWDSEPALDALAKAVGLVAGQARNLKTALEHRIGTRIPPDARTLPAGGICCILVEQV